MKKFWKIFKGNLNRGNMVALAIGFIFGAAFGAVVNSLATDVIMAAISKVTGGTGDIKDLQVDGIYYGKFLAALLYLVVVVFTISIFMYIAALIKERLDKRKPKVEPPKPEPMATNNDLLKELKALNNNLLKMNVSSEQVKTITDLVQKKVSKK